MSLGKEYLLITNPFSFRSAGNCPKICVLLSAIECLSTLQGLIQGGGFFLSGGGRGGETGRSGNRRGGEEGGGGGGCGKRR